MAASLEIGSHLCDGWVTDTSKLTGPGPAPTWYLPSSPPGRHRYPRCRPLVLGRRPAHPPRPDGDPSDPRSLLGPLILLHGYRAWWLDVFYAVLVSAAIGGSISRYRMVRRNRKS
jgi:hypothetical protein